MRGQGLARRENPRVRRIFRVEGDRSVRLNSTSRSRPPPWLAMNAADQAGGKKIWCAVFPDKPITKEASGNATWGQGQRRATQWVCVRCRPGPCGCLKWKVCREVEARGGVALLLAAEAPDSHQFRGAVLAGEMFMKAAELPILGADETRDDDRGKF